MQHATSHSDNLQMLDDSDLEQVHGGLTSILAKAPILVRPPLGACAPCKSGLDRILVTDPRIQPAFNVTLPKIGF